MLLFLVLISSAAGLLLRKLALVPQWFFGCSHIAICLLLLLSCMSVQSVQGLQILAQSVPTLSLWLKSSNPGLSVGDTEGFGGVHFQSSLQPLAWSLPCHCYHSSISEKQPLTEVGVPSSAGTTHVHGPGKTQPTSRAAPGPWLLVPGYLAPLFQGPTATTPTSNWSHFQAKLGCTHTPAAVFLLMVTAY